MKQLNFQGKTKEDLAIEFIRQHEPPEGYFLGFSGGKDSVVLKELAIRSGVKFQSYYSATGIDAPEVVKFIRQYHPDVIHLRPKDSFFNLIPKKGYPSRRSRWRCDKIKKEPTKSIPLPHRLMGIRAEESARRASRGQISTITKWNIHYKPIFYWLEWEIWDYIDSYHLPYCSLYDEGVSRIGCVICPFHSNREHKKYRERWPQYFVAFERAMKRVWDRGKLSGKPWLDSSFAEFLENWYAGKL